MRLTWHCPFAVGYRNVGMRGTVAAPSLVVLGEYCRWGALSSAVTSGATWHNTEAVLYAFRAIGRFIPTDEAAIIPQVRWATRRSLERTIRWCTFNRATLRLHSQLRSAHTGTARRRSRREESTNANCFGLVGSCAAQSMLQRPPPVKSRGRVCRRHP